jgi:hypothetical protein
VRRYVFTDQHKSLATMPSRHPLVPVRDGYRDLTLEGQLGESKDGLLTLADHGAIVRLDLSPEGVEFLLDYLPEGDGFTEGLRYARDVARFKLWERNTA